MTITDRGHAIAQLGPPPPRTEDAIEEMVARLESAGQLVRPSVSMAQLRSTFRSASARAGALARGSAQRALDRDREERS